MPQAETEGTTLETLFRDGALVRELDADDLRELHEIVHECAHFNGVDLGPSRIPSPYIVVSGCAIAFDEGGEILATQDWDGAGRPDWSEAGIADHRGGGGEEGYQALHTALTAMELNNTLCGIKNERVPREPGISSLA